MLSQRNLLRRRRSTIQNSSERGPSTPTRLSRYHLPRSGLVQEILCGQRHKISQIQPNPSGSFDTDRQSIGSKNDASILGNNIKCLPISARIVFFSKTLSSRRAKTAVPFVEALGL
jgi:hypothetical protein